MHFVAAAALTLALTGGACRADGWAVYAPGGIALSGYDTVAYFSDREAQPGDPDYVVRWRGAMWFFVNDENMERFEMDPLAYVPQYGGFCAFAAAKGEIQPADPTLFAVRDGKLYLVQNRQDFDAWAADAERFVARADSLWPSIAPRRNHKSATPPFMQTSQP